MIQFYQSKNSCLQTEWWQPRTHYQKHNISNITLIKRNMAPFLNRFINHTNNTHLQNMYSLTASSLAQSPEERLWNKKSETATVIPLSHCRSSSETEVSVPLLSMLPSLHVCTNSIHANAKYITCFLTFVHITDKKLIRKFYMIHNLKLGLWSFKPEDVLFVLVLLVQFNRTSSPLVAPWGGFCRRFLPFKRADRGCLIVEVFSVLLQGPYLTT